MRYSGPLSLFTDLYELTMLQGYYFTARETQAVFDMFYRRQPFDGGYAIFAGLDPLLDELDNISFREEEIGYLKSIGSFKDEFLDFLKSFSFRGKVYSMQEGTPVFPCEPLLRIEGSIMECQLVESMVLNQINYQTLIATKASRIAEAASGRPVLEFGLRRAHGTDGALSASRAAHIGGALSTSHALAGMLYGIPLSGTMAHSWVMSFRTELEAFEEYAKLYPEKCILLVDTFDTIRSGIPNAIRVFRKMKDDGISGSKGIRMDSGDFDFLTREARTLLDWEGLGDVKIYVSSDLDEKSIADLIEKNSPIDAWGVGTRLVTAWDDPALTGVYKIAARTNGDAMEPCMKISDQPEKITIPGIKNILRFFDHHDMMLGDLLILEDEQKEIMEKIHRKEPIRFNSPFSDKENRSFDDYARVEILLDKVFDGGSRKKTASLSLLRDHREQCMSTLHGSYKKISSPDKYPIALSDNCCLLKKSLIEKIKSNYRA